MSRSDLLGRVQDDAHRHGLVVGERLGHGMHGIDFAAQYQKKVGRFALKAHERDREYRRERDVYFRLRDYDVTKIRSCHVPKMVGFDDELGILETFGVFMVDVHPGYVSFDD